MTRCFGATLALLTCAALPLACGGSSKSNDSFSESSSSDGSGGQSSGSGGSSSGDSSGGSDGSSSSNALSSGGSDSGSNGSNGSGSGGSDSSGSGGSDSSGSGGSDSSSSTGGAGTGGGAGAPMNPVPGEEAVDACAAYCEKKADADCENEDSLAECLDGCGVVTRILDCEQQLLDLAACSETAEVTCNDNGEAEFTGCGATTLAWLSCVVTEGPDEDFLEPCQTYCDAVQEADCPNDTDSEDDCILGCTVIGTILPECKSGWKALLGCSEGEEFVCNDDGKAQAPTSACGTEQVTAWACVLLSVLE